MRRTENSERLFKRALESLSGGVNSPVRAFKAVGGTPLYVAKGEGAYIYDVDGNKYLDFCCSWGPLILGHAHPEVVRAVHETALLGTSFGTVHENEVLLAELIKKLCPHIEKLRFVSSGTEAVMSAIRLARGFTRRDKIIKFSGCYHGHSDYLLASAGSGLVTFGIPASGGVPEDFTKHTLIAPLDSEAAVSELFDTYENQIAAVIIEGVPANNGLLMQRKEYLQYLREVSGNHGTLLIFDEVISGFRVGQNGATGMYGIEPDLCTYGKVVGGGLPVGAFGGRKEIMDLLAPDGPVYQAGTLSGNPLAMAAGLATLNFMVKNDGWNKLEKRSAEFTRILEAETKDIPVTIVRCGSIFWIALQEEAPRTAEAILTDAGAKYRRVFAEALDAGIYLAPSAYEVGFVSISHSSDDLAEAARKLGKIMRSLFQI